MVAENFRQRLCHALPQNKNRAGKMRQNVTPRQAVFALHSLPRISRSQNSSWICIRKFLTPNGCC